MKKYGYLDGVEIKVPKGWKLLQEGERVPALHREAKDDGIWCYPRAFRSTMTPIYACISGYVIAIAVPESYAVIPEGATDFVRQEFPSDFGRKLFRIEYFQRYSDQGRSLVKSWTGVEWQYWGEEKQFSCAYQLDKIQPIAQHLHHAG